MDTPFSKITHATMRNKKNRKKSEQMNEKNKWNEGSLASVECVFFFCRSDKGVVFFYYLRKEGGLGFLDP